MTFRIESGGLGFYRLFYNEGGIEFSHFLAREEVIELVNVLKEAGF